MGIKMVVGLGNPGDRYQSTRHNIGRRVIEALSGIPSGVEVISPKSFMNDSGNEVAQKAKYKNIQPEEILVVLDEFQIPLKQIKILKSGSDGGHNGLKSVLECLGSTDVPRMRIGIGPLPEGADSAEFVLKPFSKTEERDIKKMLPELENAVTTSVTQGLDTAMNKFNGRELA